MTLPDNIKPMWLSERYGNWPLCAPGCPDRCATGLKHYCKTTGQRESVCRPAVGVMAKELGLGGKP